MKGSNLALRPEPAEDQPEPPLQPQHIQQSGTRETPRMPRRSRAPRTIVIRDQGLRLFRCR